MSAAATAGIGERRLRHLDDQRFDVPAVMPAEFAVRPADDAPGHAALRNAVARATDSKPAAARSILIWDARERTYGGWHDTITLRRPDDWHVHLRDGAMLAAVLARTPRGSSPARS